MRERGVFRDTLLLAVLIGLITTLWGYHFGDESHISHLPLISRAMDDSYLAADFYLEQASGPGPRFYYVELLASLARVVPLPPLFFGLTLVVNVCMALISALVARDLFGRSRLVGALAAAMVLGVPTINLGGGGSLGAKILIPFDLVTPLIFLSVWAAIRLRPVACGLAAGLGSLLHPHALIFGGATLAAAGMALALPAVLRKQPVQNKRWMGLAGGWAILLGLATLMLAPYFGTERMANDQYVQIHAYFRNPHHLVPSTFSLGSYLKTPFFLTAAGLAWRRWRRSQGRDRLPAGVMPMMAVVVGVLCLGGVVFVEIVPSRLWASAQTFRTTLIIRWLGVILMAGWIADRLERERRLGLVALLASLSPITMALVMVGAEARGWFQRRLPQLAPLLEWPWLLVAVAAVLLVMPMLAYHWMVFPLFAAMALVAGYVRPVRWAHAANAALTAGAVALLLGGQAVLPAPVAQHVRRPVFALSDHTGPVPDMAAFIREETPADAVLLTPPLGGSFRLLSERAIVVDFKSYPNLDPAMAAWQERLFDVYGATEIGGFPAAEEMDGRYREISDDRLREVAAGYGASHAVLYVETPSTMPVLYQNEVYKLVALG
jgi:hypothetical protein